MAVIDSGSSAAGKANVDATFNLNVNPPTTKTQAGFVTAQIELDAGTITGSRYLRAPLVSVDRRLKVGLDTSAAQYNFTATAQNTGDFKHQFTTMTMTQSAGFLNINPALATVSGNFANLQSWKYFTLWGGAQLHGEFIGQSTLTIPPANQVLEFGFFVAPATGIAPADGVFFRFDSAGLAGIISYNGVETSTGIFLATIAANTNLSFVIQLSQTAVEFWIDGILYKNLDVPAGQAVPDLTLNLPICLQMRNSGTVSGGITAKFGTCHVDQVDFHSSKPWAHQVAGQGNAYQGQEGDTMGQLAVWVNASSPTAGALSNTAAAFVGLGGIAQVTVSLAAATDGIIFSYQNPLGSVTQPPKTLNVTGVTISSVVSVIFAATALVYAYAIAYGHTAVSLATAETGSFVTLTTKAPRRVALGTDAYLASAAVGTKGNTFSIHFDSPIVVNPGEFFQIIAKANITAPATGALIITAGIDHYFE